MHPQPRVRSKKKHTSIVTTVTPETPGIPRAMVLTVSFALSPVTGLSCHRRLADTPAKLDASVGASGPHDFAVRGTTSFVADIARVHCIPHPTSVTIAQTPLVRGTGYCRYGFDLGARSTAPIAADWHDGQISRRG